MSQGMHRVDLPNGDAMLTMPYSEDLAQKAVKRDINHTTPDPSDNDRKASRQNEPGPIRRFNDIFTDIGSAYLEALGLDGFEIAKAIQKRRDEIFRNDFPLILPRFTHKCSDCGSEFDKRMEECEYCGSDELHEPRAEQKRQAERMFESVNKEGQSLRELFGMLEDDHGRLGVPTLVVKWDYVVATGDETVLGKPIMQEGEIIRKEVDELVRADPKKVVPVTDENGRLGGWKWACPVHREDPEDEKGRCEQCGAEMQEVCFVEKKYRNSNTIEKLYFNHEVLSWAYFFPRQHGLDGLSPVHHVWLKQAILHWMDIYAGAFYDPESDKYPNKFMVVHTTQPDTWERNFKKAEDEAKENLYANEIFVNEYAPDSKSTPELQTIELMDDDLQGQSADIKKQYKSDIRTQFGVTDVFDSELEDGGGLNNEGLQLEVTDRAIASAQHNLKSGPLDDLMKLLGFEDWYIAFVPPQDQDLEELQTKVNIGERAAKAGLEARMEDDELEIDDGEFAVEDGGGGMEDLFGAMDTKADFDDDWLDQADVYEVHGDPDGEGERIIGFAAEMPEAGVYVDWKRDEFPDELEHPHVSDYGSVEDVESATDNTLVPADEGGSGN